MRLFSSYHKTTYKKEKKMELNYKVWCLDHLTKAEFITYDLICDLGIGSFTFQEIVNIIDSSHSDIIRIVTRLETKGFLLAYTNGGLYTLWVRSHPEEEIPDKKKLLKEASAIVKSPNGELLYIRPNGIYEFAREHEIAGMTLWNLLHCKATKNRKGWELVRGFSSSRKVAVEDSNEIISRLSIENQTLRSQHDSLQRELYELNIEVKDLRRQVKSLTSEKPGAVTVSVKYLNQLKDEITLLKNDNNWLRKPIEESIGKSIVEYRRNRKGVAR